MASTDYLPLVQAARQKVLRISTQQSRDIARIYAEISADLRRESAKHSAETLTYRFLEDYARNLLKESEKIFASQRDLIAGNLRSAADATVEAQRTFFVQAAPQLSGRFSDVFSRASQKAVNELLSGRIYENFAGLSERIWNYRGSFDRDISEVLHRGILAKKPAFELAKDLELYLNPSAAKPWDWNRVYPGVTRKVDYNAQRLARTSVTHAYQLALERSTRDNPFITKYQWLVSNSHARICDLCLSRDGKYFDKGSVPLDHPNGMCTIIPVLEKNYAEIASELADWANGGENPALERWLSPRVPLTNAVGRPIIKVDRVLLTGQPNTITQKESSKGGIERNYYNSSGKQFKQISNNDHGNPKLHAYGKHGEHVHDYIYDDDGKLIDRPMRALTKEERSENDDIL